MNILHTIVTKFLPFWGRLGGDLVLLLSFLLVSCDDTYVDDEENKCNMEVVDMKFSDDCKYLEVYGDFVALQYSGFSSTKYQFDIKVHETWFDGDTLSAEATPRLVDARSLVVEELDSMGANALVLIDLAVPQEVVSKELKVLEDIYGIFMHEHLYISFMRDDGTCTPSMLLTDFAINNEFVSDAEDTKHLYANMLEKLRELDSSHSLLPNSDKTSLIVLTDGMVWGRETTLDPNHFEAQQNLINYLDSTSVKRPLYVVQFEREGMESPNVLLQQMCSKTGGLYQQHYNALALGNKIVEHYGASKADIYVKLEFPDGRIFDGDTHTIILDVYNDSAKYASLAAKYSIGSFFNPIVVNGVSGRFVTLQGLVVGMLIILLTYIVLQFIVPYARYRIFRRRYIVRYTGNNMAMHGHSIGETCYYCKAPFEVGDQIVAKCEHTMHLDCWEENGQQCPEYGRKCPEGKHFYNSRNLFDHHNPTYHTPWVMTALYSALAVWLLIGVFFTDAYSIFMYNVVDYFFNITGINKNGFVSEAYNTHILNIMPQFAMVLSRVITLVLAFKTIAGNNFWKKIPEALLRAIIAGTCSYLLFVAGTVLNMMVSDSIFSLIVEWLPWLGCTITTTLCLSVRSRIRLNRHWFVSCNLISLFAMMVWWFFSNRCEYDYRLTILLFYMAYAVMFALTVAHVTPRSEHYYLHVEGAIKPMDLALYKWLRQSPGAVVTIGKSVDCSLQMSWDIYGDVAPLQAEIRRNHRDIIILTPVEEGVLDAKGKPLPVGKPYKLYHGTTFTIAGTTFTYIEKDMH